MSSLAFLRSPLLKLGVVAAALAGAYYLGVRNERKQHAIAAAEARASAAEREAAWTVESKRLEDEARAAKASQGAAEAVAKAALEKAAEGDVRARDAREALADAKRARQAVRADPGATVEALLAAADRETVECGKALVEEQAAHDLTRGALRAEQLAHGETRNVAKTLADAIAATNAEMASVRLELRDVDTSRRTAENRSRRRGTEIAIAVVGTLLLSEAVEEWLD